MQKKTQIIPAINEKTFDEVKEKIDSLRGISDWIHIDAADGSFTPNVLWRDPDDLDFLEESNLAIEIHLMVLRPEEQVDKWLSKKIKRLIFNIESTSFTEVIIKKCHAAGMEVGISAGFYTPCRELFLFLDKVDLAQILAVWPGRAGQEFSDEALAKISELRAECPSCLIEVDGGVNPETAKKAVSVGADILVSSSYIFGGDDIEKRIDNLKTILES